MGIDVYAVEDGGEWVEFLCGLVAARRLNDVVLVISDARRDLKEAFAEQPPGGSCRRRRPHFTCDALSKVLKSAQALVATSMPSNVAQPTRNDVRVPRARAANELRLRSPAATEMLLDAAEGILAFTTFPEALWRKIGPNRPRDRLTRRIRRRSNVVGIFPARNAITRLIDTGPTEYDDAWMVNGRHTSFDVLRKAEPGSGGSSVQEIEKTRKEGTPVEQLVA